jgi:hypothetical protein
MQEVAKMDNEMIPVRVIFRKWVDTGDVIALFPYDAYSPRGGCMSYMHVGQHGEADYNHCISATNPAKPEEYEALAKELTGIGYDLTVCKRYSRKA